jgi:hypothetical protein
MKENLDMYGRRVQQVKLTSLVHAQRAEEPAAPHSKVSAIQPLVTSTQEASMARTPLHPPQASQTNLKDSTQVPTVQIHHSLRLPDHHPSTSASETGDPETIVNTDEAQTKKSDSTPSSTVPETQRNGIATKTAWTPIAMSGLTSGALSRWLPEM